ncbi:VanZ family protein [Streptomyces sp. RPT161]|uniref:VanZ family protein n=1 Tax=Streptomyces sp. RPT161 TaxID=3015993 RepID=UPI0022B93A83|nr:VanZ family protein [Streptomyces sp. RPT161]
MIRAILKANVGLIPVFLILAVILGSLAWWAARRRTLPVWPTVLFAVSLAGEFTATLYPTGRHAGSSHVCSYSKDIAAAFADQQGLMNVAMYIPVALFAVLAFLHPLYVVAACWLLSATTETVQALIPHIGRACDSQDFVTNSTGAVIGVAIGCAWQVLQRSLSVPTKREAVWSVIPLAGGAIALALVHHAAINPMWADSTLTVAHSTDQRALAAQDAKLLFGPSAKVVNIQDQSALRETPELVIVTTDTGQFSIEWPSGQLHDGTNGISALPTAGGSDAEAQAAADAFARKWFPRSLPDTTVRVYKVDPKNARRIVEYRRYRKADGLLEPMRLDIEVDPGGHIAQYNSRNVPDPELPTARITREQAIATVTSAHPGKVQTAFLLAYQLDGKWQPCWAVTLPSSNPHAPGISYLVDAVTGAPINGNVNQ